MRVKHGAQVKLTLMAGRKVLEQDIVPIDLVDAHITVWTITHGGVSGHVFWNHLGKPIPKPRVKVELVNSSDELKGDELCDCIDCLKVA